MDINKPITRAEAILSGEDLEPMSRIEYFLKKAANGGGGTDSSLPPYTSSDLNKVLTVSAKDPVTTETVIVPEQTVTFTEGVALLSNITSYTGEEAPTLGGDYVGFEYDDGMSNPSQSRYVYRHRTLGDDEAIRLTLVSGKELPLIEIGSIVLDANSGRIMFEPDSSISDVSVVVSAAIVTSVVPSITTYIIPEQTLTASDFELFDQFDDMYLYVAPLTSSFHSSDLHYGYEATLNVNGNAFAMIYKPDVGLDGENGFVSPDIAILVYPDGHYEFNTISDNEMPDDVQLTLSLYTSVPDVEPKWKHGLPVPTIDDIGYVLTAIAELSDNEIEFIPSQNITFSDNEATLTFSSSSVNAEDITIGSKASVSINNGNRFVDYIMTYTENVFGDVSFVPERSSLNDKNFEIYYNESAWHIYSETWNGTVCISATMKLATGNIIPVWSFKQGGAAGTYYIYDNGTYDISSYANAEVNVPSFTPSGTIQITNNGPVDVTNFAAANVQVPASAVVSGTKTITENGSVDVTNFATASVQVPASAVVSGTKTITTNGENVDVAQYVSANIRVNCQTVPITVTWPIDLNINSIVTYYIVGQRNGITYPLEMGTNVISSNGSRIHYYAHLQTNCREPLIHIYTTSGSFDKNTFSYSVKDSSGNDVPFDIYEYEYSQTTCKMVDIIATADGARTIYITNPTN